MNATEHLAILDHFFAAIQAGDIETVKATYHPDAEIWHNNDNAVQSVADNLRTLSWVSHNIAGISYDDVKRTPMDDGKVIQQHVLRGTLRNGDAFAMPASPAGPRLWRRTRRSSSRSPASSNRRATSRTTNWTPTRDLIRG